MTFIGFCFLGCKGKNIFFGKCKKNAKKMFVLHIIFKSIYTYSGGSESKAKAR